MIDRELIDEYAMKLGINDLPYAYIKSLLTELVEKSINSPRRSERRADGSNSKAVELCCYCHARPVAYNSWLCQFCIDEYNKEKQSGSIASR